jgi:hypothetical protein
MQQGGIHISRLAPGPKERALACGLEVLSRRITAVAGFRSGARPRARQVIKSQTGNFRPCNFAVGEGRNCHTRRIDWVFERKRPRDRPWHRSADGLLDYEHPGVAPRVAPGGVLPGCCGALQQQIAARSSR